MQWKNSRRALPVLFAAALGAVVVAGSQAQEAPPAKPVPMTLEQGRQTIAMLNDLYVTAVVRTHATYVKDPSIPAAATVARQVFNDMAKKGWPETRWISTTGRPFNPDATPKDDFERAAAAALKKGQPRFERVENGKLRVATLVPLVDASCLICHTRDKVGDPIGGLAYTIPLR